MDDITPSAAPAETPSTGGATSAPASAGGEPTAAAEPTASAPVASAEPSTDTPQASPSYPSVDTHSWDDWDGAGTGLPEQVQPWFSKFNDRWNTSSDRMRTEHNQALQQASEDGNQWKRMYEHMATGIGDDPRIADFESQVSDLNAQIEAAGTKYTDYESQVDVHMEAEAARYISWVKEQHGPALGALTAEGEAQVYGLMGGDDENAEGLELHNALIVHQAGYEASTAAAKMLKDGVPESYIMQLISSKYGAATAAAKKAPLAKPRESANVVTGATPTQTPPQARAKKLSDMSMRDRMSAVARKAMAVDKR
jgi:hypothetical protein